MLTTMVTISCTAYVDIPEITRDHILWQSSTYFATFFSICFFYGFIVFMNTSFSDRVLASEYFILSFLLGRCLWFPDKSGILGENEFRLPFLYDLYCMFDNFCLLVYIWSLMSSFFLFQSSDCLF